MNDMTFETGDMVLVHSHWNPAVLGRVFVVSVTDGDQLTLAIDPHALLRDNIESPRADVGDAVDWIQQLTGRLQDDWEPTTDQVSVSDVTLWRPHRREPLDEYLAHVRCKPRVSYALIDWSIEKLQACDWDPFHPRLSSRSEIAAEFRELEAKEWSAIHAELEERQAMLRHALEGRSHDEQTAMWQATFERWLRTDEPRSEESQGREESLRGEGRSRAVPMLRWRLGQYDWRFSKDPSEPSVRASEAIEDDAYEAWRADRMEPSFAEIELRASAAIEHAFERYPAACERFERSYGLRLPKHVAIARAFFDVAGKLRTTSAEFPELGEIDILRTHGLVEGYLLDIFVDGALEERWPAISDERLADRGHRDAPELVTVMRGGGDGLKWGLWFDDPRFYPSFVVHTHASDEAETIRSGESVLDAIRAHLTPDASADLEFRFQSRLLREYIAAFMEANARCLREEARCPFPRTDGPLCGSDVGIAVPEELLDDVPDELGPNGEFSDEELDESLVSEQIERARSALAEGRPVHALALARVLHYRAIEEHQAEVDALFVDAYHALDRGALAEIARVHRRWNES